MNAAFSDTSKKYNIKDENVSGFEPDELNTAHVKASLDTACYR